MNPKRTPEEVFGKGLMADIADFFLIDEPLDIVKFLPGGFAGGRGGAQAVANVIERRSASPGASLLRKMIGEKGLANTQGMSGLFRRIEQTLAEAARAPKPAPMNPRVPADASEMLIRRLTESGGGRVSPTQIDPADLVRMLNRFTPFSEIGKQAMESVDGPQR